MSKDYGQFCGVAKAVGALGERWALLVVRDLTVGPCRFKDLQNGLPGIPTSVLSTRLRELEQAGVVERRVAALPERGVVYALSPYGQDLQPILDALGRWGARRMLVPQSNDTVTSSSLAAALHSAYRPGELDDSLTCALRSGPAAAWAIAGENEVTVGTGLPPGTPDLTISAGPDIRALLAGRLLPMQALATGAIEIDGDPELLQAFTQAFHVPLDDDVADRESQTGRTG